MRRLVPALLALALLTPASCDGGEEVALEPLLIPTLDPQLAEDARLRADERLLRRENRDRGWQCGYTQALRQVIEDATSNAPARWRSKTMSAVWVLGLVVFLVGLVGVLAAAFLLPRLRRRRRARDDDDDDSGWLAFFTEGFARLSARFERVFRFDNFDREGAKARVTALQECRETERYLRAAAESLRDVEADDGEERVARASALAEHLDTWCGDVAALRQRLAEETPGVPATAPETVLESLVSGRRAALGLCADIDRRKALGPLDDPTRWALWDLVATQRPVLPTARRPQVTAPLQPWVRPVGWAGLGGMVLSLPMVAAWTAAGGFPLFLGLLLAIASIGATLTARFHLFQAGRRVLLRGLADRVAGWLTWVTVITALLVMASAMTTAESGFNLGEPPPIEAPSHLLGAPPPAPSDLPGRVR